MYLERCNYLEVEAYLKEHDTIIIPIGSIENHGKHMPLGTDTFIPNKICSLIYEQSWCMIAPTINYGATDDLVGFAGTISIGVDGMIDLLTRITDQLYAYGFRHFVVVNGHGGNTKSIDSVGQKLSRKGAYMAICNWWLMAGQINPEWRGGHGGKEEANGVLAYDPTLIKKEYLDLDECTRNDLGKELPYGSWSSINYKGVSVTVPRPIKSITDNGYLIYGIQQDYPRDCSEEMGKAMVQGVADYISEFIDVFAKTKLPEE